MPMTRSNCCRCWNRWHRTWAGSRSTRLRMRVISAKLTDPKVKGIELLVPPERQKQGVGSETSPMIPGVEPPAAAGESAEQPVAKSAAETMREKLHTTAGQAVYKMRKAVVEPVFGQIKERRGLRGFLLRGRDKAAAEWQIIRLTHNLLKLFQARTAPANHPRRIGSCTAESRVVCATWYFAQ